jgi:hypothetical protein
MSYTNAGKLSDEDIRAVIAYIRSLPEMLESQPAISRIISTFWVSRCWAPVCCRWETRYPSLPLLHHLRVPLRRMASTSCRIRIAVRAKTPS